VVPKPTLFLLDTPYQDSIPEQTRSRSPSPLSLIAADDDSENQEVELYGLALLRRILSESYVRNASKLVVPIPIIASSFGDRPGDDGAADSRTANKRMMKKCLDAGATDVLANPIGAKCVANLEVHAYRAHLEAAREQKALIELRRGRKRSWVGISEEKPFAYLREAMVSKLMGRICRIGSETEDMLGNVRLSITAEKQAEVTAAVGQWHFCAHDFADDELIVGSLAMFKHALSMPELEPWRIPTGMSALAGRRGHHGMTPQTLLRAALLTFVFSPSRPPTPLPPRLPRGLQHVCSISQLPPRGGCAAGDLPLSCQHRLIAPLPLSQWCATRGPSRIANGEARPPV
jgi:hypothetical protein